jgi:shikimate kinase
MKIVLIGFMCSGKSKVGRVLSQKLKWPHFDTDEMITKQVGATPADIITSQGEPVFRDLEKKAVAVVSMLNDCVISTGGGVPLDAGNMAELSKNGTLVWLRIKPETVLQRAGNLNSRPLIDKKDPLGSVKARLTEREKFYAQAPNVIDVDDVSPDQAAQKILDMISLAPK